MSGPADDQLKELIQRFAKIVRVAAARVGGSRGQEIAEDVEQQVFLNLWKQLEREQSIENPASYIYRCAIRETVRLLKVRDRDRLELNMLDTRPMPVSEKTPDTALAARERARQIADALRSLQPDRRRAAQAYLQGLSTADMMRLYGWSYERARNLSTRGMADLRAALRKRGIDG